MEFEFDKEIDALLRQSARSETAFTAMNPKSKIQIPKSNHLDADEISAFAENALPERAKQAAMLHLADCENCRKSLSNLIRLGSEAEIETARVEEKPAEKHQVASPIPWYRKLFVFPNLAYTMGALVLVFSGIVAYTILQNAGNLQSTEVSQTYEKQPNGKGMNSDGDAAAPVESYSSNTTSNANTMMSNTASMNSTANTAANFSNPAMPSAPTATMNSNAAAAREESPSKDASVESKSFAPQKETTDSVATQDTIVTGAPPAPLKPPAKEDDFQSDGETVRQQPSQTQQDSIAQNQTNITPDSRNVQRAPMPTTLSTNERRSKKLQEPKEEKEKSAGTTSVGGKNFKRTGNVWYDSAYRGQPTKNVTRGTGEYKKLDAGLRAIAENLGGTIVIVWKEKAYRIQ